MTRLVRFIIPLAIVLIFSCKAHAEAPQNSLKTKYAVLYYDDEKDLKDFLWRIGGGKAETQGDNAASANRVDRIIERVRTILDMHPRNFKVNIYITRGTLEPNRVAFYDPKKRSIYISVDYASDGVLAHEIAHAIINQYFPPGAPMKIQEILTQYVDKYLWSDY